MSEEMQAASSPADVIDPFNGEQPSMAEYSKFRSDGELPDRFKPADKADPDPADAPKVETPEGESPEPAPDPDPEDSQELKPKAAKRFAQLLEKNKELERQLAAKQDVKPESSPAPAPQHAHPKPTADDTKPDGTPKYATYEELVEDISRWAAKEERATWENEVAQREASKALQSKLDEARTRYDDADDVIFPTNKAIQEAQIPSVIKEVIARSPEFVDLLYVFGSDPKGLADFISLSQSDPLAALEQVFEYKRGIKAELAKPRDGQGKFTVPETKKTTAPKPPAPVGGASSRAFDVNDESLSENEWMRKRNAELARR